MDYFENSLLRSSCFMKYAEHFPFQKTGSHELFRKGILMFILTLCRFEAIFFLLNSWCVVKSIFLFLVFVEKIELSLAFKKSNSTSLNFG